jgi:hypothetical protein
MTKQETDFLLIIPPLAFNGYPSIETPQVSGWLREKGFSIGTVNATVEFLEAFEKKHGDTIRNQLKTKLGDKPLGEYEFNVLYHSFLALNTDFEDNPAQLVIELERLEDFHFQIEELISQYAPRVVCFMFERYRVAYENYPWALETAGKLKHLYPDALVGFCGTYHGIYEEDAVSLFSQYPQIDFVTLSETETCLEDVGEAVIKQDNPDALSLIKGISCRTTEGFSFNNERNYITDLSRLPFADFSQVQPHRYLHHRIGTPVISISGSRGCVCQCSFCYERECQFPYRERTAADVARELFHLNDLGYKVFRFYDLVLNGNIKRLNTLCHLLIESGREIYWGGMFVGRDLDENFIEKLYIAGCRFMWTGIEFPDQDLLDKYQKGINLDHQEQLLKRIKRYNIKTVVFWIIDYPGETRELRDKMHGFVERNARYIDCTITNKLTVYKGTPLAARPGDFGLSPVNPGAILPVSMDLPAQDMPDKKNYLEHSDNTPRLWKIENYPIITEF